MNETFGDWPPVFGKTKLLYFMEFVGESTISDNSMKAENATA